MAVGCYCNVFFKEAVGDSGYSGRINWDEVQKRFVNFHHFNILFDMSIPFVIISQYTIKPQYDEVVLLAQNFVK